ncbi:hypothetical protein [uncultured Dokdonia sp.]|uniref:hypothetical protein n=1 Tax=uncultured Dokdonia sp. TaxID=575653 RepID=UPI002616CD29|nr:hypothetical protein [uncultured Dokdonia sp.]
MKADDLLTAQYPDKITYKGIEYDLNTNPLEPYFENNPKKRPQRYSTALYRGYVGHFEIIENQLFVTDITIPRHYTDKDGKPKIKSISIYKRIFPDKDKVKIDWYSGILILPHGKITEYVHSGYASIYSDYFLLEIKEGNFKKDKSYSYKQFLKFKERQFLEFKKTEDYKTKFEDLKKNFPGSDKKFIEGFLKDHIINYTSEFLSE